MEYEYVVVEEFDPEAMSNRIEELLNDGWELHGTLQFAAYYAKGDETEHRTTFVQALTKKEKKKSIGGLALGSAKAQPPY